MLRACRRWERDGEAVLIVGLIRPSNGGAEAEAAAEPSRSTTRSSGCPDARRTVVLPRAASLAETRVGRSSTTGDIPAGIASGRRKVNRPAHRGHRGWIRLSSSIEAAGNEPRRTDGRRAVTFSSVRASPASRSRMLPFLFIVLELHRVCRTRAWRKPPRAPYGTLGPGRRNYAAHRRPARLRGPSQPPAPPCRLGRRWRQIRVVLRGSSSPFQAQALLADYRMAEPALHDSPLGPQMVSERTFELKLTAVPSEAASDDGAEQRRSPLSTCREGAVRERITQERVRLRLYGARDAI